MLVIDQIQLHVYFWIFFNLALFSLLPEGMVMSCKQFCWFRNKDKVLWVKKLSTLGDSQSLTGLFIYDISSFLLKWISCFCFLHEVFCNFSPICTTCEWVSVWQKLCYKNVFPYLQVFCFSKVIHLNVFYFVSLVGLPSNFHCLRWWSRKRKSLN